MVIVMACSILVIVMIIMVGYLALAAAGKHIHGIDPIINNRKQTKVGAQLLHKSFVCD